MRRYAEDTQVPIARSRAEIDRLLRDWGSDGIQWTDDFAHDRVQLRFLWQAEDKRKFMARFDIELPGRDNLKDHAIDRRSNTVSERKMEQLMEARGKQEHRLLALWLKAAFNAVAAGMIEAEALFLPFLEDRHGKTVAELAIPRLGMLLEGSGARLLPGKVEETR